MPKKIKTLIFISIIFLSSNFIVISTANNPLTNQSMAGISYMPTSFDFGDINKGEVNTTTFDIWNNACCYLYFDLYENEEWLDVYPIEGHSINGDHVKISVTINTTNLPLGQHKSNISITSNDINYPIVYFSVTVNVKSENVIEITAEQAWNLLNDISNGIQIPIDVRYDHEWAAAHIDTPSPENPKHHCYCEWADPTILQDFLDLYQGKEIILYCNNGSKSMDAANTLLENNFNGVIYVMIDGINAWIQAGYPTKANSPPNKPVISGENKVKAGQEYQYSFTATDIDEDVIYIYINWNDGSNNERIGPINSGETVTKTHIWPETETTYTVQAKSTDKYNAESEWASLEVKTPKISNTILYQLFLRLLEKINLFFHL